MTDLRATIAPKSDQLNADDLIGSTLTIRVTKVSLCKEAEQPIAVNFEGDNGKPYKPCKSMRRVLVTVWGPDGAAYAGRSMTLYRDDSVKFGGLDVGGIRISHMSGIKAPVTMALTATRAQRKPFTVKPLVDEPPPADDPVAVWVRERVAKIRASAGQSEWLLAFDEACDTATTTAHLVAFMGNELIARSFNKAQGEPKVHMQNSSAAAFRRLQPLPSQAPADDGGDQAAAAG